jgi:bifunctional UDP-N-acetylglucosamine pyrophosphorylase/glucosamine-1-phosphate N-acetyltransferase
MMPQKSVNPLPGLAVVVLAAGKGTRMKLPYSKVLAPILGRKVIDFVVDAADQFAIELASINEQKSEIGIVLGHQKESVESHLKIHRVIQSQLHLCEQKEQKGTAHALECYLKSTKYKFDYLLILCGDTPLLTKEHFHRLLATFQSKSDSLGVVATFEATNPTGYGRVISTSEGLNIIEEKDATDLQKSVTRVNAGVYLLHRDLLEKLKKINNSNAAQEYYLPDLFAHNPRVHECYFRDSESFLGINDMSQLNEAESILKQRKVKSLRDAGVYIQDASSTFIDWDVSIKAGTEVAPFTILKGSKTNIGGQVKIGPWNYLENVHVEDGAELHAHNHLVDAYIGQKAQVGPYARLRPEAKLEAESKVGNFVEIKKSTIGKKSKVPHLSYVGDAQVGEQVNIGCGFVTCNYDGKKKHKTIIGNHVFIGSDCQVVAPIELGEGSFVAAGSTITQSIGAGDFAVARSRQATKPGMAKKFLS